MIRFVIELLPNLLSAYDRLCRKIASDGFHKPGFYLSTFFAAPLGIARWKRIPARVAGYGFMVGGIIFFCKG